MDEVIKKFNNLEDKIRSVLADIDQGAGRRYLG